MNRAEILSEQPVHLLRGHYEATDPDFANAIERAAMAGVSPMLEPTLVYPVGRTVTIGDGDVVIWAPGSPRAQGGGLITSTLNDGVLIDFQGANSGLSGVRVTGPGRSSGLDTLVRFQRESASDPADLDGVLHDVILEGASDLLFVNGRGIDADNITFNDSHSHIRLGHPTSFAAPSEFANSLEGGARKYRFRNAYFHSASNQSIIAEGNNAEYCYALDLQGFHQDDTQRLFRGYLNDAVISGGLIYRAGQTSGYTTDLFSILGSRNALISNLNMGGDRAISSAYPLRRLRRFFYLTGNHVGLQILDNQAFGSIREFLLADTGCTIDDFDISRNGMAYVCLGNDVATYSAIHSNAATLSNGKVFDNRLRIPAMANNANAAALKKTGGSWSAVAYRARGSGGMPSLRPTSDPVGDQTPTSGGLEAWDDNNWMFFTSAGVARRSATYPTDDSSGAAI
jgi:hypothetical protein